MGAMIVKIVAGALGLALILVAGAWLSTRIFLTREVPRPWKREQGPETSFFDYSVTAETGYIRLSGTANFPNGVILVGTLDRIGSGPIEVKEALIMNRLFSMEFGPDLHEQYYLYGAVDALRAGIYRIIVEFNPVQQSPFAQESLLRWPLPESAPASASVMREIDPAIVRIEKTFSIGTAEAQAEAQAREQEYRQRIRRHLTETLAALTGLWQRLHAQYQQERLRGGFARTDPRTDEWRTWNSQWLRDLKSVGDQGRLYDVVSAATPLLAARDALTNAHKQLAVLCDLYLQVLTNERSLTDRDLQRTEQAVQYAFADVSSQVGQPKNFPPIVQMEPVKPTVVVTSQLANIRNRPGMSHEVIAQAKKDIILDVLGEQGEWFQVLLSGGRSGWVHRNTVTKRPRDDGALGESKRAEGPSMLAEKGPLQIEPIKLQATPVEYIPRPTLDESKIYTELDQQLRDVQAGGLEDRRMIEQRIVQHTSEKFGISPEQVWNTYLKVQGWEVNQ